MEFEVVMGLPRQENIKGTDFQAMRQAIEKGARDSGLIYNCLTQARYAGLSGEDTYTLLAFHALQMMEDFWKKSLSAAYLNPGPFVIKNPAPDAAAPAAPSGISGDGFVTR
jgi:hypothetical protein